MAVSYKKLFKMMIDRDLKKGDLRTMTGLSYSTIRKLELGENVTMDIIDNICTHLGCQVSDIAEILPDGYTDQKEITEPVSTDISDYVGGLLNESE